MKSDPSTGAVASVPNAFSAVFPATGIAAASTKPNPVGMGIMSDVALTATYSAQVPPLGCMELTNAMRSSGRWPRTSLPISSITPAASIPIGKGYFASLGKK